MDLIDSHLHINYLHISQKNIADYLDLEKVDLCWLLTWEETKPGRWPYQSLPVEDVFQAYSRYPSRIAPFYAPDPHRGDASQQLEKWHKRGLRGCGELKATLNWASDDIHGLLRTVDKLTLPVVFHMEESRTEAIPYSDGLLDRVLFYGPRTTGQALRIPREALKSLIRYCSPVRNRAARRRSYVFPGYMLDFASFESTLRSYPAVNFIAHGLMFWKHIGADAAEGLEAMPRGRVGGKGLIWRLLEQYPNLYADLSGPSGLNALTRDPQNARDFLAFFSDKILYGTDNFEGLKGFIQSLSLSNSVLDKIFGRNARGILDRG
jgi:predicted TIM-barrel fold metal-dependent hydrolase